MELSQVISDDLKLDKHYIDNVISKADSSYKEYFIPKKNGGVRAVAQPSPELKTLQYWVSYNILQKLPVSKAAFAYKHGDSIKKHARFHCESKHLLHTDISSFFPSIHLSHLKEILEQHTKVIYDLHLDFDEAINQIGKICFRDNSLCIGAVSSPVISNVIMNTVDIEIIEYCKSNELLYSRYADDIYISSKAYISPDVLNFLRDVLQKHSFEINADKTRFYSTKYRRKVTGLVLTNDAKISVGLKRRKQIKTMVYQKLVHHKGDSNQILGYLSYLKDIEPNTYNNLIIKYSKYCKEDIIKELMK